MELNLVKQLLISLVIAILLVVIVNIIGELALRPPAELPPPQTTEISSETQTASEEEAPPETQTEARHPDRFFARIKRQPESFE